MSDKHHGWKTLRLKIQGMHCANCEVLIERKFKKISGIRRIRASHATGVADVTHYGELDIEALQSAVEDGGYVVSVADRQVAGHPAESRNSNRDYLEIGAVFLILVGLYMVLTQLEILPDRLAIPNTIGYGLAFAIGVVASLSTCMAVTGGLLVAVAAKYNEAAAEFSGAQRFKPHIYFNAGRIISYTLLGGVIGALGSTFTLSPEWSGLLMIVASALMIALGLQMLKLFPALNVLHLRMPKFFAHAIHDLSQKDVKGGAFILGASTFFLPCGFTQALQLYVLAKGSFGTGALIMLAFSLGTLPALVSLSALSSFARGSVQRYFLKFAGVAVVLLGLLNIQSGLTLTAIASNTGGAAAIGSAAKQASEQAKQPADQPLPVVDGKQILDMKVVGYTYEPHRFTVVQGIPVEWRIDAQRAAGCGRFLIAPRAGVRKLLPAGPTVITFTPQEPGEIRFNCSMGMMTRGSGITVVSNTKEIASAPVIPAKATTPAPPQPFSSDQRGEIERLTREYLLQHPEVLQEALAELERRQQLTEAEQRRATVKEHAPAIFDSRRQVVLGNPQGDVTLVEFFDYNCGYCKRALSDMLDLLKSDPKLKVVLREFPVLGDPSVEAARVAIGVRMQDDSSKKYLEFHQKLLGSRGQADRARALAVAKEIGLDMARLERDMASPEVKTTLEENFKLADAIGLTGTPSYVVGSEVVIGALGVEALERLINAARTKAD